MAHGGRHRTKAAIQRVETSNRGNGNQDWQLQERWLHNNYLEGPQQQGRQGQEWGQLGSNSGGKEAEVGGSNSVKATGWRK